MDQTKIKWFTFKTTLKAKRKVMTAREKTLSMQIGMKMPISDTKKANIPLKTEPFTVANGWADSDMGSVNRPGQMEPATRANGKITKRTVEASSIMLMVMFSTANGATIRPTATAPTST